MGFNLTTESNEKTLPSHSGERKMTEEKNTEMLCEHGRIFLSLVITPTTAQIQPLTTTVCLPER
jgi:hypothetical protein